MKVSKKKVLGLTAIAVSVALIFSKSVDGPEVKPSLSEFPNTGINTPLPLLEAPTIQPEQDKADEVIEMPSPVLLAEAFGTVASAYAEQMQYPEYSVPIRDGMEYLITPNPPSYTDRDYSSVGLPVSIQVKADKTRYFSSDNANFDINVTGNSSAMLTVKSASLELMDRDGKIITESHHQWRTQSDALHHRFSLPLSSPGITAGSYNAMVHITFSDNGYVSQSTPIDIVKQVGKVKSIGFSNIENNELLIPVRLDLQEPGFYRLSGIVEKNGSPVAHLTGSDFFETTQGAEILLKLHGKLIIDSNLPGNNVTLTNFRLTKIPSRPGDTGGEGEAEGAFEVRIPSIGFDEKPYESSEVKERLAFLAQMSEGEE